MKKTGIRGQHGAGIVDGSTGNTNARRRQERVETVVTCSCGNPYGTLYKKVPREPGPPVYWHKECPA